MFESLRSRSVPKTAVCLHISYPPFAVEILKKLEAISAPFTLIVSHSGSFPEALSEKLDEIKKKRPVEIHREPNIGFDILPFLYLLPRLKRFEIVCKPHTGRNYANSENILRDISIETLIGSDRVFRKIVRYLGLHPTIGMLGPAELHMSSLYLLQNDECDMHTLLARFAPDMIGSEWGYFAGGMFWARTETLSPICDLTGDLEAASRYEDREMASAVATIFGLFPGMQNRKVAVLDLKFKGLKIRELDDLDDPKRNFIGPPYLLEMYKGRQSSRVRPVQPMRPSPVSSTITDRVAASFALPDASVSMCRSAALNSAAESARGGPKLPVDRPAGKAEYEEEERH